MHSELLPHAQALYFSARARAPKGTISRQRRARRCFTAFNLTRVLWLGENWNS
jgi:hypothetical protein